MKIKVLASGSKGNSTYIECGNTKILIDAGISYMQIKKALEEINVNVCDLNIILITHTHSDHIKGLCSLIKKTNATLYITEDIYSDLLKNMTINNYYIIEGEKFKYNDLSVELLPVPHDVSCYSFLINYKNKNLVYITDTGYLNKRYFDKLKNKDVYIIESNHDETMLMDGPYPFILKQRILSDRGHLSNKATARILTKLIGDNTKYIFLAHISEHNNTKQLAFNEITKELSSINFDLDKVILTDQYISLEMVEV